MRLLLGPTAQAEANKVAQCCPSLPGVVEEACRVHLRLAAAARAVPQLYFLYRHLRALARPRTKRHGCCLRLRHRHDLARPGVLLVRGHSFKLQTSQRRRRSRRRRSHVRQGEQGRADASMRPPAKPTLRHAASIMAVLVQWNQTPGSCKLGLPPQISKNSASPMVGSTRYLD